MPKKANFRKLRNNASKHTPIKKKAEKTFKKSPRKRLSHYHYLPRPAEQKINIVDETNEWYPLTVGQWVQPPPQEQKRADLFYFAVALGNAVILVKNAKPTEICKLTKMCLE